MSTMSNSKTPSEQIATDSSLPSGFKSIVATISSMKDAEKYSDLTIKCEGQEWRVHKTFVCPQSSYLEGACSGGFKESIDGVIDLDDFHPRAVQAVIDYLYEQTYNIAGTNPDVPTHDPMDAEQNPLLLHVMVYTLADYLGIPSLEGLAVENLRRGAEEAWNTVDFSHAIRELYERAPDKNSRIRQRIADIAAQHAKELLASGGPAGAVEFRKVVTEVNVFGTQFQMAVAEADRRALDRVKGIPVSHGVWICQDYKRTFVARLWSAGCPFCHCHSIQESSSHHILNDDTAVSQLN